MRPGSPFQPADIQPGPATSPYSNSWHGPMPYLFGGLAAMLGLIALALLILACSYLKIDSFFSNESSEPTNNGDPNKPVGPASPVMMQQLVTVFMPGEEKPTFIATPTGNGGSVCTECEKEEKKEKEGEELGQGDEQV